MKKIITIAVAAAAVLSCVKNDPFEGEDRSIRIAISPEPVTFTAEGKTPDGDDFLEVVPVIKVGSKVIKEGWKAVCDADFATLSEAVVKRNFTETYSQQVYVTEENGFTLEVAPNTGLNRIFTVSISYQDSTKAFVYSQKGSLGQPYVNIAKKNITVLSDEVKDQVVGYDTNLDKVEATSDATAWCTATVVPADKNIVIKILSANSSTENDRVANITVKGTTGASSVTETIVVTQLASGKSTYDGISSAADLRDFMTRFNAGEGTSLFEDADGVIRIKADIDMSTISSWTPIGTGSKPFAGVLDGQNHKIYNISMTTEANLVGLFGGISGTVKNIIIGSKDGATYDGVSAFTATADDAGAAWTYVGSISARTANGALLENIVNYAPVGVLSGNNKSRCGGITGISIGTRFTDCKNYGRVFNSSQDASAASLLAGIAAIVDASGDPSSYFTRCENHGDVASTSKWVTRIGGIVGQANPTDGTYFSECKNFGDVTIDLQYTASAWTAIAGILAQPNGVKAIVDKCENHGNIICTNLKQVVRCGGIMGTIHGDGTEITGCLNKGKVSIIYNNETPITNWESAGGIGSIMENKSGIKIIGNVNEGEIYVKVNSNVGHLNHVAAAGIVGVPAATDAVFKDNVNKGTIYCENTATTSGSAIAGGLVGLVRGGVHSGGQNFGNVKAVSATSCTNAGFTAGTPCNAAGGLYGINTLSAEMGGTSAGEVDCATAAGQLVGVNFGATATFNGVIGGKVNGTAVASDNLSTMAVGVLGTGTLGTITLYSK